jgi:hypothetical protein
METATPEDAARYFNKRLVDIWKERDLGELPRCLMSHNPNGTVNFSYLGSGNGMSPFFTVNHKLVVKGVRPDHPLVDLQDGDQFYNLIDRVISDVC